MPPPLVYDHEAGTATPAVTLEKASRTLEPSKPFVDFMQGLVEGLESESRDRIVALHRRGVRLQKAYEGDWGDFHPTSGKWMPRPGYAMGVADKRTGKSSPWYPHNKIRRYFDANTAQTLQSRIDLRAVPMLDDDRSQLAADAARPLVDYHEQQIFHELFVQDWDKQKRGFGQVFFLCYWDIEKGMEVDEYGVSQEDYKEGGSIFTCLDCAQSGDEQDFADGACPQCGGQNLLPEEIEPMTLPAIGVQGKKKAGDCAIDVVPSLQHNFDRLASSYEAATWYERERKIRIEEVQAQFPWYKIPRTVDSGSALDRSGIDLLEDSTGNNGVWGMRFRRPKAGNRALMKQFWIRPALLDVQLPEDVPLLSGEKISKDYTLAEQYPSGMYALFCNRDILDIWDDRHFDYRWVQLKHKHIPNRLDGDGGEDILRPAQEYNEARSFAVGAWKFNAARPRIIRKPLTKGDYSGQPGDIAEVEGLPYEIPMANLEHVSEPVPLDQSVLMMLQSADAEMQAAESAFATVTGDPDVQSQGGGKTMGGLQLIESNAQEQRLPELSLVAHAYRKLHLNLIRLFRDNASEERCIPLKASAGELAVMYLKGADLDGDIDLSFGKGSYLPKDSARKRANLMGALEVGQGIVLSPMVPPMWKKAILEAFEIDVDLDETTQDVKNARARIEEMKRLAPQAQQMASMVGEMASQMPPQFDPMTGQPMPPPSPAQLLLQMVPIDQKVDEHQVHFAFIKNWLKGDEAKKVDPVINEAMHLRLDEHEQAGVMIAAQQQMMAMQAQAPMMEMQKAEQNEQSEKENQGKADDREHQLLLEDKRQSGAKEIAKTRAAQTKAARK